MRSESADKEIYCTRLVIHMDSKTMDTKVIDYYNS